MISVLPLISVLLYYSFVFRHLSQSHTSRLIFCLLMIFVNILNILYAIGQYLLH